MKSDFSRDMFRRREEMGISREEFGALIGVSAASIQKWEDPTHVSFPKSSRWPKIKEATGIDPKAYKYPDEHIKVSGDRSAGKIVAVDKASVSVGNIYQQKETQPELGSRVAYLDDKEFEVYSLYKRFGNMEMLGTCLETLLKIARLSGAV
jgi:transcriptional regulator with XRE-family HTH domain